MGKEKEEIFDSPYEAARRAGLKSEKNRKSIKTEWCMDPNYYKELRARTCLDTHRLGRKAHVYGSSLK